MTFCGSISKPIFILTFSLPSCDELPAYHSPVPAYQNHVPTIRNFSANQDPAPAYHSPEWTNRAVYPATQSSVPLGSGEQIKQVSLLWYCRVSWIWLSGRTKHTVIHTHTHPRYHHHHTDLTSCLHIRLSLIFYSNSQLGIFLTGWQAGWLAGWIAGWDGPHTSFTWNTSI